MNGWAFGPDEFPPFSAEQKRPSDCAESGRRFQRLFSFTCETSQSGEPGEPVILSGAKNLACFTGNGDPSLRSG
jgi:hypothetical protein